jgi:hypothetical protein
MRALLHKTAKGLVSRAHRQLVYSQACKSVSTWSSLATAFNTKPERKINLSLTREDTVRIKKVYYVLS